MPRHLSVGNRWRIISSSLDQGMPSAQIASVSDCSIRTVYYILQFYREADDATEREGRGRALLSNTERT
ncbi:unnamed protein product [Rotaria sp. Silwood2]|nr:unnamed protein product [Rotaria sp. Silwood2]CAF3073573.1 unnamed protein product [Rotaria sp. Silwood2]CAF3150237.1 unnamed protein product [Rotaria sp. Silwood2]CAF4268680.1 unnamed protein product [Rotaria sp. Silwood2]CAF4272850.1 unnamed protein product [Rotaria sp. Silwood2]